MDRFKNLKIPSLRGSRQTDAAILRFKTRVTTSPNENGSVFFYILIAIALFAALSYAVSRNNSGSTNIFTEEQIKLVVQEIIEYSNNIANAVQKLRLRGCGDTQISFENDIHPGNYANPYSPTDKSCHIFDSAGGNIQYAHPPEMVQTYQDSDTVSDQNGTRHYHFSGRGAIRDVGTEEAELFLFTRMRMNYPNLIEICNYINEKLGVNYVVADGADTLNLNNWGAFRGIYEASPLSGSHIVGDQQPMLAGKAAACFREGHGGDFLSYYQVLIAR